jgi:hypothetical protein
MRRQEDCGPRLAWRSYLRGKTKQQQQKELGDVTQVVQVVECWLAKRKP